MACAVAAKSRPSICRVDAAAAAAAGVCVAVYFGISAFWQYLAWFVEKDYVCASRPETVRLLLQSQLQLL